MRDRNRLWKKGSRVLALVLAGAMALSLGADLGVSTQVYAAPNEDTEYICGETEHKHTADCYSQREKKELVCVLKEHTHGDDCYETAEELTCTKEEHEHSDDCYDEEGNLTCELTEHTHGDDCYTVIRTDNLTCDEDEHEHNDDCYETVTEDVLTCDLEEHTHDEFCVVDTEEEKTEEPKEEQEEQKDTVSNEDYDSKYTEDAEKALEDIDDDDLVAKLVAVAESQVGYTEQIADDTDSDVYTLYSNWYSKGEDASKKWTTLLAVWCLDQAGFSLDRTGEDDEATDLPIRGDLEAWIKAVKSNDYYTSVSDNGVADLAKGDIAFLDLDGDEDVDHVGIITAAKTDDDTLVSIDAVIGDLDAETLSYFADDVDEDAADAAVKVTFSGEDYDDPEMYLEQIVTGYVDISSYVDSLDADGQDEDVEIDDEICGYTYTDEATMSSTIRKVVSRLNTANNAVSYASNDASRTTGVNMNGYITNASFQKKNGVIWEESTEFTTADQVRGTINFENVYTSTIKNNGNTLYIDLPAYIDCSQFTGTYDTYDGSTHSGTYTYQKNADGTYRIVLKLDDDYVNNAGDTIGGSLQFNFTWTKEAVPDSGNKKVEIGNWSGDIKITEDKSGDDKPSSANYQIWKSAGSLQIDENGYAYIDYTVSLTVKNGMTAPINMKDVLTGTGFTYDSGSLSISGGNVKANFGSTEGQGTSTQIQVRPNDNSSTVPAGTYTIKYRVKSLNNVTDPDTKLSSEIKNTITVPEKGDDSISSETHTSTTSGVINKQGQLVSGTDATYIDYTVYLNAGAIIKNLKTPANFTDTLPDTLELQGDVTVKQYDVTGTLQNTTTATVEGQKISYTTPTGQYYYVVTYRTKVKDSELPIGGSVTIKNDGKSTGGVDGSSSSEITITNHKLTKTLESGSTDKDTNIRKSNWVSNIAVKGDLGGYIYEDYSSLYDDSTVDEGKSRAMTLVSGSVVVKDKDGNTISPNLYTLEDSDHKTSSWSDKLSQNVNISDGLFKITFKNGVTGPVTIEYQTTTEISKLTYGYVINYAELSKDGHTDKAQGQDTFDLITNDHGLIIKKQNDGQWDDTSGTTTLNPGQTSIPWVILVNRDHKMSSDFTVTDTIEDGLIFLPDTFDISINGNTIKGDDGVTWSYDKSTGKLTVSVKEHAYRASNQTYTHQSVTISFRTQLPDSVIEGDQTEITYSNTATLETDGSQYDSTYDQKVIRQVVGKSGSYDKTTHILSYNVIVNPDGAKLNGGDTLTVVDTLDAGSIADYVSLRSLELFTALKTTDSKDNVTIEPGELVRELTQVTSGKEAFTYTLDSSGKVFNAYLPDETAYVIVAKYYVDTDVTEAVDMKNTVSIVGNESWKKEDSSTKVEATTSGETHTNKVVVVKHDTAQYSTLLSGASFELNKYENNTWTKVGDATTGSDGTASINPVAFDTLYKLGETQAPDGYVLDEGPTYFIVVAEGTSDVDAREKLPESIAGDSKYSKDAVRVYTAKTGEGNYISVSIDRYNTKDTTRVNPGEILVNKIWVDSKGQTVTDASSMPDITVTLTKHVTKASTVKVTLINASNSDNYKELEVPSGSTVTMTYTYDITYTLPDGSIIQSNVCTLNNVTEDTVVKSSNWIDDSSVTITYSGGSTEPTTTDTVVSSVVLNAANNWTYLWSDLERGDGITYTLTEQTVNGYNVSYKINGSDLEPGKAFTPRDSGDKVTVTNTAVPEYELPHTGGAGTLPIELGGFAATLGAMFVGYSRRRRDRKEGET